MPLQHKTFVYFKFATALRYFAGRCVIGANDISDFYKGRLQRNIIFMQR